MSENEAAKIWTEWVQNQLSARYLHAAGYRVEVAGARVRVLDENGGVRSQWDAKEPDFVGHLLVALDPSLQKQRESFWTRLRRFLRWEK